jgi:hypothetical protein
MKSRRSKFCGVLLMALLHLSGAFAGPSGAKTDPALAEGLSRGRVAFRQGDLVEARRQFEAVLKLYPEEPMALEYMAKIDAEFNKRVARLLKNAEDARLEADELLAAVLDGQPNDAAGLKRLFDAVAQAAAREEVPLADLDWFLARPSTAPFHGVRAEKLSKLKSHLKTKPR